MSQELIVRIEIFSLMFLVASVHGLCFRRIRKFALVALLASGGTFALAAWLNQPFVEAQNAAQKVKEAKADILHKAEEAKAALRKGVEIKADANSRVAGFLDAADNKMALAVGFPDPKIWGTVRAGVIAIVQTYPNNSLMNADCKYADPGDKVKSLNFPATKQYPTGTRDIYRCHTKEEFAASAARAYTVSPPLSEPVSPGHGATDNIVKSRSAIVCASLTNAQIVFQLSQAKQLDKASNLEGCWHIPKGKEVMVLSVAGGYAFITPMDDLSDKAWTSVHWLDAN